MPTVAAGFSTHMLLDASPALSLSWAPPPWFSRITFQVNCLHSNPCLGSGSGEPKLKQMVTREYLRIDEGSGEVYCSHGPFSGGLNPCPLSRGDGPAWGGGGSGSLDGCPIHNCSLPSFKALPSWAGSLTSMSQLSLLKMETLVVVRLG